jgi:lactoylglutathione lyase
MKILHTMLRVSDLDASIDFYCAKLGMQLKRRNDYPGGEFTLAFVGYEDGEHEIELTHNWDGRAYDIGSAYGHVAIGVPDIYAVCETLRAAGVTITREPGPMKHGSTVIAFVKDPTGYPVELIQRV